jgi:hypothetical protein
VTDFDPPQFIEEEIEHSPTTSPSESERGAIGEFVSAWRWPGESSSEPGEIGTGRIEADRRDLSGFVSISS